MHPTAAQGSAAGSLQGLALRTDKAVLPHHFWIGVGQPSTEAG